MSAKSILPDINDRSCNDPAVLISSKTIHELFYKHNPDASVLATWEAKLKWLMSTANQEGWDSVTLCGHSAVLVAAVQIVDRVTTSG